MSHAEVGSIVGCDVVKVKSLVFQARSSLIETRKARDIPCMEIREQLATATGGVLRRGPLRRHLRECEGCAEFRDEVSRQRKALALLLPVAPTLGLKKAALAALGFGGGGERRRSRRRGFLGHRREDRDGGSGGRRRDRRRPADRPARARARGGGGRRPERQQRGMAGAGGGHGPGRHQGSPTSGPRRPRRRRSTAWPRRRRKAAPRPAPAPGHPRPCIAPRRPRRTPARSSTAIARIRCRTRLITPTRRRRPLPRRRTPPHRNPPRRNPPHRSPPHRARPRSRRTRTTATTTGGRRGAGMSRMRAATTSPGACDHRGRPPPRRRPLVRPGLCRTWHGSSSAPHSSGARPGEERHGSD